MSEQKHAKTLVTLSDIDIDILRLQKQLEELPQKKLILETRQKSKELEEKATQVKKMGADAARTLKLLADEIERNDNQITQAQASLDKSKEYREASALTQEMKMLSDRKAKLEEDSLAQLEKQEKIATVEQQIAETAKKLNAEEQAYTDSYRQAGGKLKQDIADMKHAREMLVASLPEEVAQRYVKALENKGGIGATHLAGNQCSGCHGTLSEGQVAKLQEGPPIGTCPNCNRIIVTIL